MKTLTLIVFIFFYSSLVAEKYQDLMLEETSPTAIKSPENAKKITENCQYLTTETVWNPNLYAVNNDQCELYSNYSKFSNDQLRWIDEVKLSSVMDDGLGMEVEVLTFYKDGQEVEPTGFLESQIEPCSSLKDKDGLTACMTHFGNLAIEMKNLMDASTALAESAPKVISETDESVKSELSQLEGSKKLSDVKRAKELKNNSKSIVASGANAKQMLPSLALTMAHDYSIIMGVSKTLKKMENGL